MAKTRSRSKSSSSSATGPPRPVQVPSAAALRAALQYLPARPDRPDNPPTTSASNGLTSALRKPNSPTRDHTVHFAQRDAMPGNAAALTTQRPASEPARDKRRNSIDMHDISDNPPPKRVRSVTPSQQLGGFQPRARSNLEKNLGEVPRRLPLIAATTSELVADMMQNTRALTLAELTHLFYHVQLELRTFSQKFFAFELDEHDIANWPLHDLNGKYAPLMRTAQYIADGSQNTWRRFFTSACSRPHLVYGILGEWFKEQIFGATAFGMSESEIEMLEDNERRRMHYDSFVRAKHRGLTLHFQLISKSIPNFDHDLNLAINQLTEQLLVVLEPLMPTFMASPNTVGLGHSEACALNNSIRFQLEYLIQLAAKIHLGIRLAGQEGVIVRFCPQVERGTKFNAWAPQNCINKMRCDEDRSLENADDLRIKMTCFSRIEATTPYGPDQLELEVENTRARRHARHLARNASDSQNDESDSDDNEIQEGDSDNQENVKLNAELWPWLPDSLQDQPHHFTDPPRRIVRKRGAYVTISQLSPADVYCEWNQMPDEAVPHPRLSLQEAILEAREQKNLHYWDQLATLADKTRPVVEWTALAFAVAWLCGIKPQDLFDTSMLPGFNTTLPHLNSPTPEVLDFQNTTLPGVNMTAPELLTNLTKSAPGFYEGLMETLKLYFSLPSFLSSHSPSTGGQVTLPASAVHTSLPSTTSLAVMGRTKPPTTDAPDLDTGFWDTVRNYIVNFATPESSTTTRSFMETLGWTGPAIVKASFTSPDTPIPVAVPGTAEAESANMITGTVTVPQALAAGAVSPESAPTMTQGTHMDEQTARWKAYLLNTTFWRRFWHRLVGIERPRDPGRVQVTRA